MGYLITYIVLWSWTGSWAPISIICTACLNKYPFLGSMSMYKVFWICQCLCGSWVWTNNFGILTALLNNIFTKHQFQEYPNTEKFLISVSPVALKWRQGHQMPPKFNKLLSLPTLYIHTILMKIHWLVQKRSCIKVSFQIGLLGYKKLFMLNSAEHEILNAYKYKNIKKFSLFLGSDKHRMLFFLLIDVKIPTFMSRKNFMLSWVAHQNFFRTSG